MSAKKLVAVIAEKTAATRKTVRRPKIVEPIPAAPVEKEVVRTRTASRTMYISDETHTRLQEISRRAQIPMSTIVENLIVGVNIEKLLGLISDAKPRPRGPGRKPL